MQQKQATRGKKHIVTAEADPEIPDKLYFRIGEAARLLSLAPYVLRFWESEFPQLRPNKGGTGQRLYRRRDVEMALRIKRLLYEEGYTIPGARQLLKTEQHDRGFEKDDAVGDAEAHIQVEREPEQARLRRIWKELKEISMLLEGCESDSPSPSRAPHRPKRGLHLASRRDPSTNQMPTLFPTDR